MGIGRGTGQKSEAKAQCEHNPRIERKVKSGEMNMDEYRAKGKNRINMQDLKNSNPTVHDVSPPTTAPLDPTEPMRKWQP